jgi:hypothetical protein
MLEWKHAGKQDLSAIKKLAHEVHEDSCVGSFHHMISLSTLQERVPKVGIPEANAKSFRAAIVSALNDRPPPSSSSLSSLL